jgi:2-amino-4-hydroxy-6-hydroxymethyldihydropteridine diphosphokinase
LDGQRYLVALGSNLRHPRFGAPASVLRAALVELDGAGLRIEASSPIIATNPLGPSRRRFANAAAILRTGVDPPQLLARLHRIEQRFGRSRRGARWGPRVLDLDIILWDGGAFSSQCLTIPHIAFRQRRFVLDPATRIAPRWRDPLTGLTLRHLRARLTRPRPVPSSSAAGP